MSIFEEAFNKTSTVFSDSEQTSGAFKLVMELLNKPEIGGISGLIKSFEENGMGGIISSWIGTGENLLISSGQIHQVLGGETMQNIANHTGLPLQNIASDLSNLLPLVIDKLTPNGEVSDSQNLLVQGLGLLKGKLSVGTDTTV